MARIGFHRANHALQYFIPFRCAHFFAQFTHTFAHVTRARILGAINAVAKSGHRLTFAAFLFNICGRILGCADFLHHFHHIFCRAAMRRPRQRGQRSDDGAMQIGFGSDRDAGGEAAGIAAMLSMKDEIDICQSRRIFRRHFPLQHP